MSKVFGVILSLLFIIIAFPFVLVGSIIFGIVMSADWVISLFKDTIEEEKL